jgi:hypothetical protein
LRGFLTCGFELVCCEFTAAVNPADKISKRNAADEAIQILLFTPKMYNFQGNLSITEVVPPAFPPSSILLGLAAGKEELLVYIPDKVSNSA